MIWVARNGHVGVARLLLDRNANIETVDQDQMTALMLTASSGNVDFAKLLLDRNANIEAADRNQWTSLMWAAHKGYVDAARFCWIATPTLRRSI